MNLTRGDPPSRVDARQKRARWRPVDASLQTSWYLGYPPPLTRGDHHRPLVLVWPRLMVRGLPLQLSLQCSHRASDGGRIQLLELGMKSILLRPRNIGAVQHSLVGGAGSVIPFLHPCPHTDFLDEFQRGVEKVHQQLQLGIELVQQA